MRKAHLLVTNKKRSLLWNHSLATMTYKFKVTRQIEMVERVSQSSSVSLHCETESEGKQSSSVRTENISAWSNFILWNQRKPRASQQKGNDTHEVVSFQTQNKWLLEKHRETMNELHGLFTYDLQWTSYHKWQTSNAFNSLQQRMILKPYQMQ